MKQFEQVDFDFRRFRREAAERRALLRRNPVLQERRQVLPFFRKRRQLSAHCGYYHPVITRPDLIAWEYDLFGDFQCDLVVGDSEKKAFCFVDFEDAGPDSVFQRRGRKATREWSRRFDHGYSQIVDWFYKIADRTNSEEFEARFGKRAISYEGLLVVGRDQHFVAGERLRLDWRKDRLICDSKKIHCVTYDELLDEMNRRLESYAVLAAAKAK
jgi:hypothetical protein